MLNLNFLNDISYHKRTTRQDLVHHLMGNGNLQAVIQITENPAARNALVLHMMNPERFENRHKSDSFTFHQQLGPELTMVGVLNEGNFYLPNPRQTANDLKYVLDFAMGYPLFRATYPLDYTIEGVRRKSALNVKEEIFCPPDRSTLIRQVSISNQRGLEATEATLFAFLVPNQFLFPEAHYITSEGVAIAGQFEQGDEFLGLAAIDDISNHIVAEFPLPFQILSDGETTDTVVSCVDDVYVRPKERYTNYPLVPGSPHVGAVMALQFDLGELEPGQSKQISLLYSYGQSEQEILSEIVELRAVNVNSAREQSRQYWQGFNELRNGNRQLDNLYLAARAGLRASVSATGRMNAGIWGYGAEWVRDSSLACAGAILSGQFEMARSMLAHMLVDMVSPEGMAFGEGQFYEIQRAELDQNGELLQTVWLYWVHSRDDSFIREHWAKLQTLAEFPLRSEFWVEEVAMVRGERDVRERDFERHGLFPGYELAHQMWVSIGLSCAADLADYAGDAALAERWRELGKRMWDSVLHHPEYRLVENDYFMKRRKLDGQFQRSAQMKPYIHRPTEEPLTKMYPRSLNRSGDLEPDASEAWPIARGLVDPESKLARRTLLRMEQLWNQEWDFGGYPLHNVASEPTKLGSWPMTFYFITQANVEARNHETVRRNLNWFMSAKDGRGYMWWEYRDANPDLQIDHGVIPWLIYGEPLNLLVHHMLGYRPVPGGLIIRPRLLPEQKIVTGRMRNGVIWIDLTIYNEGRYIQRVEINGEEWADVTAESVILDLPRSDMKIEIWLGPEEPETHKEVAAGD